MDLMPGPLRAHSSEPLRELPFVLDLNRAATEALHAQVASALRAAVLSGRLPPGTALPATRTLARTLGVARGVAVDAYAELAAEGYLEARQGSGTRVAAGVAAAATTPAHAPAWLPTPRPAPVDAPAESGTLSFRVGQPTTLTLDRRAWAQAFAHAARQPPPGDYGDPAGEADLRAALAALTTRARGLRASPEDVVVTAGTVQAVDLIARALVRPGDPVVIEEPGYRLAHQRFADAGAHLHAGALDDDGLIVERLPPARLVYVTPSHQFPLGVRMSVARRLALLAWAEAHDALIIEDDYDGEYRYGAPPLPPLASLDTGGRVLYLATLSKVLTPALRVGHVIAPPAVRALLVREKHLADAGNPWPVQAAVTWLLQRGHVERHVRRTRRHYAAVQASLAQALAPLAPLARLGGVEAGLHACLHLAATLDARAVAAECAAHGVRVSTLDEYSMRGRAGNALLLGYGGLTLLEVQRGATVIRDVVTRLGQRLS